MQRTVAAADVAYRLLFDDRDLAAASDLITGVWGDPALAPPSLLRAYTHFGNPTIGAFRDGQLCGVSVGFLAPSGGVHLHSHITGVRADCQHLGIGFALKCEQRAWCLDNGIDEVTWTFDPLLARNAHFNMRKLGANAAAVLPNFYGPMNDAINEGDETDRLEVHWRLTSDRVQRAVDGDRGGRDERPIVRTVGIPRDYAALRGADAGAARAERARVRAELEAAFADGLTIVDFNEHAEYCFAPGPKH